MQIEVITVIQGLSHPSLFNITNLILRCSFLIAFFVFPAGISVSISTFSLVAIAIERYSAICNPLKSRSWQTRSHAYRVITATWVLSLLIMVPYPVFSILRSFPKANNTVGHMCRLDWPSPQAEQAWWVCVKGSTCLGHSTPPHLHLHPALHSVRTTVPCVCEGAGYDMLA